MPQELYSPSRPWLPTPADLERDPAYRRRRLIASVPESIADWFRDLGGNAVLVAALVALAAVFLWLLGAVGMALSAYAAFFTRSEIAFHVFLLAALAVIFGVRRIARD